MNSPIPQIGGAGNGRPPALEARGPKKSYTAGDGSELRILRGVELRVEPGEVVAIIGAFGWWIAVAVILVVVANLALYPITALFGGVEIRRFARAVFPAQVEFVHRVSPGYPVVA